MYLVTKLHTAGSMAGLTTTENTAVRFEAGREYKSVAPAGRYVVTECRDLTALPAAATATERFELACLEAVATGNQRGLRNEFIRLCRKLLAIRRMDHLRRVHMAYNTAANAAWIQSVE